MSYSVINNTLNGFAASPLHLDIQVAWWHWCLLGIWFTTLILIDILVVHRKDHVPKLKEAVTQSAAWVSLSVLLGAVIWLQYGSEAGIQFTSGYLIEQSLSIDNVFAWSVILTYFKIPKKYQHRVLFWGVFGAIVLRIIFILAGITLIEKFEPTLAIFGLILLYSGYKLLATKDNHDYDPRDSKFYKLAKKVIPLSHKIDGHKLFTKEKGKKVATILFMALVIIEFTDLLFAVDSVPAILAVSRSPFIIIASNAAAILGMRSLYFVFDIIKDNFWLLNYALGILLLFIGLKMFIAPEHVFGMDWLGIHIPTLASLGVIGLLLTGGVVGSLIFKKPTTSQQIEL